MADIQEPDNPDAEEIPSTVSLVNQKFMDFVWEYPFREDMDVTVWEKIKLFSTFHWRGVVCLLTPIVILPILLPFPAQKYQWCAYTLVLMAVYWVTECIPLPITSFLPVVIFPLTNVMDTDTTCQCYMNDTVIMFFGSMVLAYAVEQSGLHKRLALGVIRCIGYSHYRLLFAMSMTTMFISMWITNTAATTLMVPINFALLKVFEDEHLISMYEMDSSGEMVATDITTCYFCTTTFSATIGGIGTLVGTATNLVFRGLFAKTYPDAPEYLSFPKFSGFAIPYMLMMNLGMYLWMLIVYFGLGRPNSIAAKNASVSKQGKEAAKRTVTEEWKKVGRITFWEIMVIILFGGAILLFFSRSPQVFKGWGDLIVESFNLTDKKIVQDSAVAILVIFLMLLLPSNLGFFKNFTAKGGGFALSEAAKPEYSDLNGKIGDALKLLKNMPNYFIILLIIIFTVFVTNFASNVAVCNVITPLAMQLAKEIGQNPLWYNIAAGYSASYCYCLPVGTPGNLVVQSAARIPTIKMIKAGIGPSILTVLISWICICFWAPVVWPDLHSLPDWIK